MNRKSFAEKMTAVLLAAALGMSTGACGSGEDSPTGGTGTPGTAEQTAEGGNVQDGNRDGDSQTAEQGADTAEETGQTERRRQFPETGREGRMLTECRLCRPAMV